MPTVDEVLDLSRSQLGNLPNQYWDWYPIAYGSAWCCVYQSWVLTHAGIDTHYAWVSAIFDHYRDLGRNTYDIRSAQPGDLIAFEWDGTGQNSYDHIAMVESVDGNGVTAINGNWGGHVTRAWHSFNGGGIAELARPEYSTQPTPTPPNRLEDEDMKRYLLRGDKKGEIYLTDAGLGWKWAIPAGQLANVAWVIGQSGGQLLIPPGSTTTVWENQTVWVAEQAFVDAIPTTK